MGISCIRRNRRLVVMVRVRGARVRERRVRVVVRMARRRRRHRVQCRRGQRRGGRGGRRGGSVLFAGNVRICGFCTTTFIFFSDALVLLSHIAYTSLLRITTTPPAHVKRASTSLDTDRDHQHQHGADPLGASPAPPVTTLNSGEGTGETAASGGGGLLAGLGRPGFLRGLSRGRPEAQTGANAV